MQKMATNPAREGDFLSQVTAAIEQNLANEQFGVSELADTMNMSRSNLLRKVKKESKLSVSQLINQIRLQRAMEMLRKSSMNVSEVSMEVGFNSVSYFIKCFREYYGYPPGEVGKRDDSEEIASSSGSLKKVGILIGVTLIIIVALGITYFSTKKTVDTSSEEKSIAVLPFKNESSDSTNLYLINGLMESTLNNLQKIKDLRVISRTSTEKYRNTSRTIPEMGNELNVRYFVEGSGQKIGDEILLSIQLIEASSDSHLWSKQYRNKTNDIFQLEQDVAKNIAEEIAAIITPEEARRIEKIPTKNLEAYDLFLKGNNYQSLGGNNNLEKAIDFFKQAITKDTEFALAYAEIAISYYNIDLFKADRRYLKEITFYADKALLYDSKLGESLMAKALDYISKKEFELAEPYLEKALEYNPNSTEVLGFLTDFYAMFILNTGKYLKYALKGVQLNIASQDSVAASYTYLRLGNALIQNGFVDESLKYIDKSLQYNPANPFSRYVRAFILYAKHKDASETRDLLITEFNKDTTRFDILQDIGKICYFMGDYKSSYKYYRRFIDFRKTRHLDVYRHENLTIGYVLLKMGYTEEANELIEDYKTFIDADKSVYHDLGLCAYYVIKGDKQKAIEHMKLFSQEDNVQFWIILFMGDDPQMSTMMKNPEFKKYFDATKSRFWKQHDAIKKTLQDEGLI